MLGMLLAYDDEGRVIATLDFLVFMNEQGDPVGLVDFEAAEAAGMELTDIWNVQGAHGSGSWPEWLGSKAQEFKVIRDRGRMPQIAGLEHVGSREGVDSAGRRIPATPARGYVRRREDVERKIAKKIQEAKGQPADIRDVVGGPERPLLLDDEGNATVRPTAKRPNLPVTVVDMTPTAPANPEAAGNPQRGRKSRS
jgi:hypothetical protein